MNFMEKIILKNEKKRIIILILLMCAAIYGVFTHIHVYRSMISGPSQFDNTQITNAQYLDKIEGINSRYQLDFIKNTNHGESTTKSKAGIKISEKDTAHYYLAKMNDYYFVVQAKPNEFGEIKNNLEIEATLRKFDNFFTRSLDIDIYNRISQDPSFADIKNEIVPGVILYAKSKALDELIAAYLIGLMLLMVSWFTIKCIRILNNPTRHKTLRFAKNNFGDLDQLSATLEREKEQGLTQSVGGVTAYKDYITFQKGMTFELLKVQDLLMMYVKEKKKKVLFFITLKTTRYLHSYDISRVTRQALSKKEIDFVYTIVTGAKPEIIFGHHADLIKLFYKNPNELDALIAERKLNL